MNTIQVSGANLFALAAQYLGDATQWNRIAELNGLTDFMVYGSATLAMPSYDANAGTGGVLNLPT